MPKQWTYHSGSGMQQSSWVAGMEHVPVRLHHSSHEQAVVSIHAYVGCVGCRILGPEVI